MDKKKAMEWVEALRSGKFKKGWGSLKHIFQDKNECVHCCLGVLGEINGVPDSVLLYQGTLEGKQNKVLTTLGKDLGSRLDGDPVLIKGQEYESLADANDSGESFADIADYIEANYEHL